MTRKSRLVPPLPPPETDSIRAPDRLDETVFGPEQPEREAPDIIGGKPEQVPG